MRRSCARWRRVGYFWRKWPFQRFFSLRSPFSDTFTNVTTPPSEWRTHPPEQSLSCSRAMQHPIFAAATSALPASFGVAPPKFRMHELGFCNTGWPTSSFWQIQRKARTTARKCRRGSPLPPHLDQANKPGLSRRQTHHPQHCVTLLRRRKNEKQRPRRGNAVRLHPASRLTAMQL